MNIDVTLNIHYSAPKAVWDRLGELYRQMPGWAAAHGEHGCTWTGQWFGTAEDPQHLTASVEPGGLQLYGELPEAVWTEWITLFKDRAGALLGYEIGEPEEGYDFRYYDEE